ncbi:Lipase 1 [Leucoagaricus sp. SymC.cos]|nr:Lipase 1 [Leucoagaricus sp. SymC.cos]
MRLQLLALLLFNGFALSASVAGPTVALDNGTFTGLVLGPVIQFLGIPYAQPPVGNLRYRLPHAVEPYIGNHLATAFGLACPQQNTDLPLPPGLPSEAIDFIVNAGINAVFPDSEDCLTINVIKPSTATSNSRLPVVVVSALRWIFSQRLNEVFFYEVDIRRYDGGLIVNRSITLGTPIIFVSMNYRHEFLAPRFGFLASKEVKAAGIGNLGLQDQRQALRWVQKYIGAFGGDPAKVTIWGESAGAISISLHMLANNGNTEGLFRAAFMQSGSPLPVGDITNGQELYDTIVAETGCSGSADTLDCLRNLPYDTLKAAIDKSPGIFDYQSLRLAWPPRADGTFITDNPQKLIQQGVVANIPFVTGDCDDEGTLFSFSTLNVTTESQFREYIGGTFWKGVSTSDVDHLATLYTADVTTGSPYDTGITDVLTPQYKRLASFQGDAVFQAPRRFFLQNRSGKQNTWVYLSKRFKTEPYLGSASPMHDIMHVSDLFNIFGGEELTNYLINFVIKLDPNGLGLPPWPKYTTSSPQMLTFWDGFVPTTITQDTFRREGIDFITNVSLAHPL